MDDESDAPIVAHVAVVRLAGPGAFTGALPTDLLGPAERARADAYSRPQDRRLSEAAALLVRAVAGEALGVAAGAVTVTRRCPLCAGPHGAPFVADAPLLSVSHCADLVAVAACSLPVGVDVEPSNRRGIADVAGLLFGADEPRPADDAGILRTWVRKEAVVKATGHGLTVPLDQVVVTTPDEPAALLKFGPQPGLALALTDVAIPGAVCSLAVVAPGPVEVRQLDGARMLAAL